jgi:hypothetical protein
MPQTCLQSLASLLLLALTAGCPTSSPTSPSATTGPTTSQETTMPATPKTDLETLRRFLTLPAEPTAVQWDSGPLTAPKRSPGPDDWGVVAVLTFDPADLETILDGSPPLAGRQAELPAPLAFPWLPTEATAGAGAPQSGFVRLQGAPRDPKLFVKDPLLTGYLLPLPDPTKLLAYLHTR